MYGMGTKEPSWLYSYLPDSTHDIKVMLISDDLFEKLYDQSYSAAKTNLKRSMKPGVDIEKSITSITLKSNFRIEEILSYDENVIGYIEGTDLKDEFIIICGHYDHLGMQPKGVCLGADDNASGTAGVMELARMCSKAKKNGFEFRRSIVFIAFCAEESGLNGSNYYVENPIFPLEKTALVINMDMIGRSDTPPGKPGYGFFRPIKGNKRQVKKVLRSVDRQMDDLHIFFRQSFKEDLMWYMGSDHYPFVKKGIPALVVTTGDHIDYHTPTDTPDKINFENMVNILKSLFVLITEVSSEPETFPVKRK
jgi:Zn-dependent M28 family amino/carboxypeptidase